MLMKKLNNPKFVFLCFVIIFSMLMLAYIFLPQSTSKLKTNNTTVVGELLAANTPTQPLPTIQTPPAQKILPTDYHIFQSFNNCGPAALSMALRFYGIDKSQEELGQSLRPWQNPGGINDDKSVTLEEVAQESKKYGFVPYRRPNGDMEKIKMFITYDMPVITRTWLEPGEDIGHYRVVKGYNSEKQQLIQDDSLQNKNLWYSYDDFNAVWDKFNYEYLVLVPKDKQEIAETILGEDKDSKIA